MRLRFRTGLVVAGAVVTVAVGISSEARATAARDGRQLYDSACRACHGADGRGAKSALLAFDLPLPDFTDCKIATREPDRDWAAVVSEGGPKRAFDKMMPAFGDALDGEETARVIDHVRSFCEAPRFWPRGDLNFPRAMVTEKAFVEDEAVLTVSVSGARPSSISSRFIYEKRVGPNGQIEAIVPFGLRESDSGDWSAGLGDLAVGTKWALLFSQRSGTIASVAAEVILPTGNKDKGFGKGVTVIEPFVSFGQAFPKNIFFQLQVGAELSTEPSSVPHEVFWRSNLGILFSRRIVFAPMIELVGFKEIEEDQPAHFDLVPEFHFTLSKRQHVRACLGVGIPLDDFQNRKPYALVYLLWDWYDGALTEGW